MATICTAERARGMKTRLVAEFSETNGTGAPATFDCIAAPGAGYRIVVVGMMLTTTQNMTVSFRDETGVIAQSNLYVYFPLTYRTEGGILECSEDEKFQIVLSVNGNVSGWVEYVVEKYTAPA